MQHVEEPGARGLLSPGRAFLLLLGVLVLIGGAFALSRPEAPDAPAPQPAPAPNAADLSLTNAEAIARFRELHGLFRQTSRTRDVSLLSQILTSDSRLRRVAEQDIKQLLQDGVVDKSRFLTRRVRVLNNTPDAIALKQIVIVRPRFVSVKSGRDVSEGKRLLQEVKWELRPDDGEWRVFDALVVKSRELSR